MTHEYLKVAWSIASHPVAAHLLQSTLFAGLAALLTLAVRSQAQIRHSIWVAASLKFLIPLSVLLDIGVRLAALLPRQTLTTVPLFIGQISRESTPAFSSALLPLTPKPEVSSAPAAVAVLSCMWFCGFAALAISWFWRWRRVASAVKNAAPLESGHEHDALLRLQRHTGVRSSIRLAVSTSLLEPGVFGIRRPVLLLPQQVSIHLAPDQLEAVLAHEVVHIRRHDNLFAALHMVVEAIFWFHPLVWWLGAKLVAERERACDEEVLRLGNRPGTYAEAILCICKLCLTSPLPCVSGVTGSDLKRRIEQIMSHQVAQRLNRARKSLLAVAGAAALVIPIAVGLFTAPRVIALQTTSHADRPSFTVASVKPADPNAPNMLIRPGFGGGGRFSGSNLTLRFLIKFAYDLRDDQISGGPNWLDSKRFDIDANCDPPFGGDLRSMSESERKEYFLQIRLRLQSLLADRFQLKISHSTKDLSQYQLVVAKNGPKLKEVQDQASRGMRFQMGMGGHLEASGADMEGLARILSEVTGRTVIDKTGLTGRYDIKLEYAPDPSLAPSPGPKEGGPPPPSSDETGPTLLTALQEQLGLKLESYKGPADVVHVDSAQLPSEN